MDTLYNLLSTYYSGLNPNVVAIYSGGVTDVALREPNWTYGTGELNYGLPALYNSGAASIEATEAQIINEQSIRSDAAEKNGSDDAGLSKSLLHLPKIAPSISVSGQITGNSGWLGYQKPYITISNKRPVGTEDLNKYIGLPINKTMALNTVGLTGYTEISEIFLPQTNLHLLESELTEIKSLLSTGVIL